MVNGKNDVRRAEANNQVARKKVKVQQPLPTQREVGALRCFGLNPQQVIALKNLGLETKYFVKAQFDEHFRAKDRFRKNELVLFKPNASEPYQQGEVVKIESHDNTYLVKIICRATNREYSMKLSSPNIVPLLPRAF